MAGIKNITRTINALLPAVFRVVLVLLILASFGMALSRKNDITPNKVLGAKQIYSVDRGEVEAEITKTIDVIHVRPDYSGAWLRLAVLYGELGQDGLSKNALETARKLNPDLATTDEH